MFMILGYPAPLMFGQLLLGLINGAFYALLSLGLAVIFGMLNIVNFAHGALFMLGAFVAWGLLNFLGINYWAALILAPIVVGAFGVILEKTLISRLYKLDHLYGLLLTFGLALVIEGLARNEFGSSGVPYPIPSILQGATNLGFMVLPNYRAWVIFASLAICLATWFTIERTRLGAYLRAGTENPALVQAFWHQRAGNGHADLWCGCGACGNGRRAGGAHHSDHAADGQQFDYCGVCGGGDWRHGLDFGLHPDRLGTGAD